MDKVLNVVYSSDDNYAQHLGVSLLSLLKNNQAFEKINIFIIDNDITESSKIKLIKIINKYSNVYLQWIAFLPWKDRLNLNMEWNISLSSYGRLFLASMIPESVNKILYLDCDTVICGSFLDLWNSSFAGIAAGVQDTVSSDTKSAVGLVAANKYINAGVLLIDLFKWRKNNIEEKCMDFIKSQNGKVRHHDQGVLNGVLKDSFCILPLKYNVMTIHYMFSSSKIKKFFNDSADFYSQNDIDDAKKKPVVIHYTPSFTSRPWVNGCCHPLKKLYWDVLKETPWAEAKPEKNNMKLYVRIADWYYRKIWR